MYTYQQEWPTKPDVDVTKHIVQQHQALVLIVNDREDRQRISICRSYVFDDAV